MAKPKKIKVTYAKLGRSKAHGMASGYEIEVDERLRGKKKLEIILHEALHCLFPFPDMDTQAEEDLIAESGAILARTLWHEGVRFVDSEDKTPLQDEK